MGWRRKPVLAGITHRFLLKAFALLFQRAWLEFFSPYLKLSGSGSIARVKEAQSLFVKYVVHGALPSPFEPILYLVLPKLQNANSGKQESSKHGEPCDSVEYF